MAEASVTKKLHELLVLGTGYLQRHGVAEARVVCELLAAHVLRCGRLELTLHRDKVPDASQVEALRDGLRRLARGEPLQYVLGEWDFRRLTLKVDKRALIPRPETERLVELVLGSERVRRMERPLVVDVGTGSGCIVLSLAHELPDGIFIGLDISTEALELARENASFTGLAEKVYFAESDGCGEFDPASVDLLVSNPPYIASREVDRLERHIREHEPRVALDGGADGLRIFRALLLDAVMVLKPGGCVFFEIGHDQGRALEAMLEEYGFSEVRIHRDDLGRDRYASGVLLL